MVGRLAAIMMALTLVCSGSSRADSGKARRLKVAGWTTTAVGSALAIAGMGIVIANGCSESQPGCDEEDMFQQTNGWITMSVGVPLAVGVGMPMLIRSRKLSKRSTSERVIVVTPRLAGVWVSGTF